jgi:hypothetical protein
VAEPWNDCGNERQFVVNVLAAGATHPADRLEGSDLVLQHLPHLGSCMKCGWAAKSI